MEVITETIIKGYKAYDGKIFATEKDCRNYEGDYYSCKKAFDSIRKYTISEYDFFNGEIGDIDCTIYFIPIKDENTVNILNSFMKSTKSYIEFTNDMIGTIQIVENNYEGIFDKNLGTPENVKDYFCKCVDDIIQEIENKEEE